MQISTQLTSTEPVWENIAQSARVIRIIKFVNIHLPGIKAMAQAGTVVLNYKNQWDLTRTCDQLISPLLRVGSFDHQNWGHLNYIEGHCKWRFLNGHQYDGASSSMLSSKYSAVFSEKTVIY